jgi:hypothetical protein
LVDADYEHRESEGERRIDESFYAAHVFAS